MEEKITLIRYSNIPFTVNYDNKKYVWAGSKGNIVSKKAIPIEVYDFLTSFTTTFEDGELVVDENSELAKELVENIVDKEAYENNAISKEDLIKILNGNINKMKSELEKITCDTTKRFVLATAKEIKVSNANKQKFIKEWLGSTLSIEDLFEEE